MWTSDKRLYLTPDGEVSEEPVSGGKLLVPVGGQLSDDDARALGLIAPSTPRAPRKPKAEKDEALAEKPEKTDQAGESAPDGRPTHETKPLDDSKAEAQPE